MHSPSLQTAQELDRIAPDAIAWLLWKKEQEGSWRLSSSMGIAPAQAEKWKQDSGEHTEILNQAFSRGNLVRGSGSTPTQDAGVSSDYEILCLPLNGSSQVQSAIEVVLPNRATGDALVNSENLQQLQINFGPQWVLETELPQHAVEQTSDSKSGQDPLEELWQLRASTVPPHRINAYLDWIVVEEYADRASIWKIPGSTPTPLALSGTPNVDANATEVQQLTQRVQSLHSNQSKSNQDVKEHAELITLEKDNATQVEWFLLLESFDATSVSSPKKPFPVALRWPFIAEIQQNSQGARNWSKTLSTLIVLSLLAVILAIPVPFSIQGEGELLPTVRRNLFAPEQGIVPGESLQLPETGTVTAGQELLRIESPQLNQLRNDLDGKIATTTEEIRSLTRSRSDRERRDPDSSTASDISIRLAELSARLEGYQTERRYLETRLATLSIHSPISGQVLTWDAEDRLRDRPVELGQLLLSIGDPTGPWEARVRIADRDQGYLKERITSNQETDLKAVLTPSSQPEERIPATLDRMGLSIDQTNEGTGYVAAYFKLEQIVDLAPGSRIEVTIECGKRSLGFVLFRTPIDLLRGWFHSWTPFE